MQLLTSPLEIKRLRDCARALRQLASLPLQGDV